MRMASPPSEAQRLALECYTQIGGKSGGSPSAGITRARGVERLPAG